jgi:hypothetical protein
MERMQESAVNALLAGIGTSTDDPRQIAFHAILQI